MMAAAISLGAVIGYKGAELGTRIQADTERERSPPAGQKRDKKIISL
jgi:hypothetical protein